MRINMNYIIETKELYKHYGDKIAVNKMSLHIKKGDIYGLIGKNEFNEVVTWSYIAKFRADSIV